MKIVRNTETVVSENIQDKNIERSFIFFDSSNEIESYKIEQPK